MASPMWYFLSGYQCSMKDGMFSLKCKNSQKLLSDNLRLSLPSAFKILKFPKTLSKLIKNFFFEANSITL
jgi:hypothetical protein